MGKNSCGWCESTSTCVAGDELGPFDPKSKCKTFEPTADWQFATRDDNKREGETKGALTVGGLFLGISILLFGLFIGALIGGYIIYFRRNNNYTSL